MDEILIFHFFFHTCENVCLYVCVFMFTKEMLMEIICLQLDCYINDNSLVDEKLIFFFFFFFHYFNR